MFASPECVWPSQTMTNLGESLLATLTITNVAVLFAMYIILLVFYRLFFHPLSHVPGPRIAALTSWYCIYYDVFDKGRYVWEIEKMHNRYGPVVRIMPDAVHVNDPAFIDQIYPAQSSDKKRERAWTVTDKFLLDMSMLPTRDHDLHRRRRAAISPFFSQKKVRSLAPIINETLALLLQRMEAASSDDGQRVLNMSPLCRAVTADVMRWYAFGSKPSNILTEDCNADFFDTLSPKEFAHVTAHFRWFSWILFHLPQSLVLSINPGAVTFVRFIEDLTDKVNQAKSPTTGTPEHLTIFHEILGSNIPESEKTTERLVDEAMVLTIAGSDTTALTLLALMYHVLSDRTIFRRLRAELDSAMPDPNEAPDVSKLDRLPFLNALIEETLRLYPGVVGRQDRVAPEQDLIYQYPSGQTLKLPAGTVIGMTAPLVNRVASWFPEPDRFLPDRYIQNPKLLRRHFSFSKGGRQCLGMNLAYAELQVFTAGIFRKYGMFDETLDSQPGPTLQLFETTREDVAMYSDFVTPGMKPGSLGVRVKVRGG